MAQVGAHDRVRMRQERVDQVRDVDRSGDADRNREHPEAGPEDPLEERQLDLERVLGLVRPVVRDRTRLDGDLAQVRVDPDRPERRAPHIGPGHGRSVEGDEVRGTEERDLLDLAAAEERVCRPRDRTREHVPRVRDDQGQRLPRIPVGMGSFEQCVDLRGELVGVGRIEGAGGGGGTFVRGPAHHTAPIRTGSRCDPHLPGAPSNTPGRTLPHASHRPRASSAHAPTS